MPLQHLQKVRLVTLGVVLLVFVAGFLLGLAWDHRVMPLLSAEAATDTAAAEEEERDRRPPRYSLVGLSSEQQAVVDSVVLRHRAALRALQKEFSESYDHRYWNILESTRSAIRDVMTPPQATKYDSLLADADRRREEREEREERRDRENRDENS